MTEQQFPDLTSARVVCDSVGPSTIRLTTIEATYPLIIHSELMTHRVFSRNVASNRAIPVERMIQSVMETPFIPKRWPRNKSGMQNSDWLEGEEAGAATYDWLVARNHAVQQAKNLQGLSVHKQITNRLLAPWLYTTAVVTATEWANFFSLRCHPAAQPEIQGLAYAMWNAFNESEPCHLSKGQWHTPYFNDFVAEGDFEEDFSQHNEGSLNPIYLPPAFRVRASCFVSVGRCAGISYLRQGEEKGRADAFGLALKLREARHWSPFEHVAQARGFGARDLWSGNFRGWRQLRKHFDDENISSFEGLSIPEQEGQL